METTRNARRCKWAASLASSLLHSDPASLNLSYNVLILITIIIIIIIIYRQSQHCQLSTLLCNTQTQECSTIGFSPACSARRA
jgi:hypothetical protein